MIKNLEELLSASDIEKESIYGIIGRMEVLMDIFKSDPRYHNLIAFHEVYYLVTKKVADYRYLKPNMFKDIDALNKFDVIFASLYFKPLKEFLMHSKSITPWETYFNYSKKDHTNHFVQMLLGINAHINTDLITALKISGYNNKDDFNAINGVLCEVLPEVMRFLLIKNHEIFAFGGIIFKDYFINEFHKTILIWRKSSWERAFSLDTNSYKVNYHRICQDTEEVGLKIIDIFGSILHLKHVNLSIEQLHNLIINS
jgi:hypothetical protein